MSDPRVVKAVEVLQPHIDKQTESVLKEIALLISDNKLTADLAVAKCHELNALQTLPKKLIRGSARSPR